MTNAVTEAPDEEGAQIDLIQHCCKRLQARWLKHIRRVRSKGGGGRSHLYSSFSELVLCNY